MPSMRPGVFTDYTLEPMFKQNYGRCIGIAAKSLVAQSDVQKLTTFAQAKTLFGEENLSNPMIRILKTIFDNCSSAVYAVSVLGNAVADYSAAVEKLANNKDVYVLCADCVSDELNRLISVKLKALAAMGKEKIAVVGTQTPALASQAAKYANCERICVTYPPIFYKEDTTNLAPAAMAALIAKSTDFSSNLNGEIISGGLKVQTTEADDTINTLIKDGVCVFEQAGNFVELIRGVTSAAYKTDGLTRNDYFNLCVILTADIVIPQLRAILKTRLENSRNSRATLDSLLSLVACKLEDFVEAGYLSSYEMPSVYLKANDNSVCIVDVKFTLLQGINQIYLSAKISI